MNDISAEIRKAYLESGKVEVGIGVDAIKLCATFNAGALIAILGFLGVVSGKGVVSSMDYFIWPLGIYGVGLIFSGAAFVALFFAQSLYSVRITKLGADGTENDQSLALGRKGDCCRRAVIALGSASFILFIVGGFMAMRLLSAVKLAAS